MPEATPVEVRVDVWSDIACPWCFVGKRHLERAVANVEPRVEVVWHAYELNPKASVKVDATPYVERLARKYRCSVDDAQSMIDRMVAAGAQAGLDLRFDRVVPTNTFDGHRLVAWAQTLGKQSEMKERLLVAYMTEGANLGDRQVLSELAAEIGLHGASEMLEGDGFKADVREDEETAYRLGISGVPFFVVAGRFPLSGAQPPAAIAEAIQKASASL